MPIVIGRELPANKVVERRTSSSLRARSVPWYRDWCVHAVQTPHTTPNTAICASTVQRQHESYLPEDTAWRRGHFRRGCERDTCAAAGRNLSTAPRDCAWVRPGCVRQCAVRSAVHASGAAHTTACCCRYTVGVTPSFRDPDRDPPTRPRPDPPAFTWARGKPPFQQRCSRPCRLQVGGGA